ncbi:MAG: HAD hydrolase family protein [Sulfurospirillum sp.]|nr:HAD hydrolase family protein [Sulfurospirillum sp.]
MIKLFVFDVDGCMSDGSIIYDTNGCESKIFDVKDGFAMISLAPLGFKSAIITGRESAIVARRAKELQISHLYQNVKDKKSVLQEILKKEGLGFENVAAIGDDFNDLRLLRSVGHSFAPNDANEIVKKSVTTVLSKNGGRGAVREMIEIVLAKEQKMQEWITLWQ